MASVLILFTTISVTRRVAETAAPGPWDLGSVVDQTKVAFLLGTQASPLYAPLLLQFLSVLPHEWKLVFTGSDSTVAQARSVPAIMQYVETGKMTTLHLPSNVTISDQETLSQFLTEKWTYDTLLAPVEHLLIFQLDSIICANSERSVDDYLQWAWVGAPWYARTYGGNGGLSLRRVHSLVEVLSQRSRPKGGDPEDIWLVDNLMDLGIDDLVPENVAKHFGVENIYVPRPMSYHTGGGGKWLHGAQFGSPERREEMYDWCPEIKMHVAMDIAEFVPGNCEPDWF